MFLKLRSTRIPSSVKFAVIPSLVLMRFKNFFHKLDCGSLPVAGYECLWPRESRQNMGSRLRRNEGLVTKSNVRIVTQTRYQSHAAWEYVHR